MKTQAELEAMPERLRRGFLAADLIAAHVRVVHEAEWSATAAGRAEKQNRAAATPPGP